jgi:ABC-2 type transport system ATP-binding protein
MPESPTMAVETEGLTRRFGDLTAVDQLNLSISGGEIFGLLGPNGAGKTTVIKMLTTLLPPSAGTARVAGFDIQRQPARVRAEIAYVPQLVSADGGLTAVENLRLFAKLYGVPRREIRRAGGGGQPCRARLFGRHGAPPRNRVGAHPSSARAFPGRTHRGP